MWQSQYAAALGCGGVFAYPHASGRRNYNVTGSGFGMKRRKILSEGLLLMTIPFDIIHTYSETPRVIPWVPEPYQAGGLEYVRDLRIGLELKKSD
jgi:hypothetical protein